MNHSYYHRLYRIIKDAFPILLLFLTVFIAVQKISIHHQFYLDLYNSFPLSKSGARVAAITLPLGLLLVAGLLILFAYAKSRSYLISNRKPWLLPKHYLPMVWTGAAALQLWGLGQLPQLAKPIYPEPDIGRNDSDIPL